jgi:ParB-like chromosome segregation protein Spo0J
MKLSQLKPNPKNPRTIKDERFKKLVKSLQEFPEMMAKRPMVCVTDVDGKLFPLGGNMRLKALQEIGMKEIPDEWVTLADDWTEEKRQEFVIKDNVGFGEWDWNELQSDWDLEQLEDWGLEVPSFEEAEQIDLSQKMTEVYRIEVICSSEEHQEKVYNKLIEEGYECRILTL